MHVKVASDLHGLQFVLSNSDCNMSLAEDSDSRRLDTLDCMLERHKMTAAICYSGRKFLCKQEGGQTTEMLISVSSPFHVSESLSGRPVCFIGNNVLVGNAVEMNYEHVNSKHVF